MSVRTSLWASDSFTRAAQPRTVLPVSVTELCFRMTVFSSGSLRSPASGDQGTDMLQPRQAQFAPRQARWKYTRALQVHVEGRTGHRCVNAV